MTPRHSAARRRRGFTAVEIAMVASVIAILALLILPVFRQRAEDARQAAARDELASIVKALLLVEADIPGGRHLPQLSDLDNLELPAGTVPPGTNPEQEPGRSRWYNDPISPALSRFVLPGEIPAFYTVPVYEGSVAPAFRGPYVAMKNTLSLAAIAAQFPQLTTANGGPISIFTTPPFTVTALNNDRYPVDPWGTPYLLFGPEGETIYNFRAVYSLGADGLPGGTAERAIFGGGLPANAFRRQGGLLGRGDDLEFRF